jgi:hypothetical protein
VGSGLLEGGSRHRKIFQTVPEVLVEENIEVSSDV